MTTFTDVMPFHVLSKLFRVHKNFAGVAPCVRLSGEPWLFLPICRNFCLSRDSPAGKIDKTKLNSSLCSGHLKHQGVDGTRRHEWPPVPVSHKAGKEAREEHDEDGWGIGREIEYFGK